MSDHISASTARLVRIRAQDACEYCRLPQWCEDATFHIDHIEPLKIGGPSIPENLALACVRCSLKKSSRTHGIEPESNALVRLFHPRNDKWTDHFRWSAKWRLVGLTPIGRATIYSMGMNRPSLLRIRRIWAWLGKFPPPLSSERET